MIIVPPSFVTVIYIFDLKHYPLEIIIIIIFYLVFKKYRDGQIWNFIGMNFGYKKDEAESF